MVAYQSDCGHWADSSRVRDAGRNEGRWPTEVADAAPARMRPRERCSYRAVDYRGPLAIVVGNERRGLAREWLAAADSIATIPMLGSCGSLNAAVAGALLLYQAPAQDSAEPQKASEPR
jgi:tRNA C32,U32 (ribose-2'-O)-methylase TrmJ